MPELPEVETARRLIADEALHRPPPGKGRPLDDVLAVVDRAAGKGLTTASPGYFAFIPGSGIVTAAIADLIAVAASLDPVMGDVDR